MSICIFTDSKALFMLSATVSDGTCCNLFLGEAYCSSLCCIMLCQWRFFYNLVIICIVCDAWKCSGVLANVERSEMSMYGYVSVVFVCF